MQDPHAHVVQKIVQALKAERERLGLSHEALAVQAGLSDSCIRHLEKRRAATPTLITLLKLSAALDLDLSQLLKRAMRDQAL